MLLANRTKNVAMVTNIPGVQRLQVQKIEGEQKRKKEKERKRIEMF
jgi:hypothetical protein